MEKRLVLASVSRYKRAQMDLLQLPYEACDPDFSEEEEPGRDPEELVVAFALGKARAVAAQRPEALVVATDQAPALDGRILRKPGTAERAVEQLLELSGRWHRLLTAVAVVDAASGRESWELDVARLKVRALTRELAAKYVALESPLDCAGAYKTEGLGIALFEEVEVQDPTALVGLPLLRLTKLLRRFDIFVLEEAGGQGRGPSGSSGQSRQPETPRK